MTGSRPAPLLMLPGLLCDARIWPGEVANLSGGTVAPSGYGTANTLEEMADRSLEGAPPKFSLLGHSMGARVALEIVRRTPERVERLALVSTGVHAVKAGEAEARHALLDLGREKGMQALVDRWLPPMVAPGRRSDAALIEPLRTMCTGAGLDTFAAQISALLNRPEVQSLLPSIACPTLVLVGDEDQWSPPAQHQAIAAAIPGAEMLVIKGAGHMLPAEEPALFVSALRAWLARETIAAPRAKHAFH